MAFNYSDQFDSYPLRVARFTTYDSRGGVNVVKTTPGFIHIVTFAQVDAAPTAGDITIYNTTTGVYASSANILFKHSQTTAVFMPQTVTLDVPFGALSIGISTALGAAADVGVTISYK